MARFLVFLLVALPLMVAGGTVSAVSISFEVADIADVTPGRNLYRYSYTLSNFSHPIGSGFSVAFDRALYTALQESPPAVSPDWNVVSLQPDQILTADGQYDAQVLVGSPSTSVSFTVEFEWWGTGTPGSQTFTVYDTNFNIVEMGQTVPEPALGSTVAFGVGLIAFLGHRSRRGHSSFQDRRTDAEKGGGLASGARAMRAGLCLFCPVAFIAGGAVVATAEDVEIDNFTIVSSARISRTVFEYTLTAEASNWGNTDATIIASLASTDPNTVVVEGALGFGELARGATGESTDTFTIRQDRRSLLDVHALVWSVQAIPLAPTTFELIEQALANGVISEETALVYKVFFEFGDERLPLAYRGRASSHFEATALGEAELRFGTLSPDTQAILAPFLTPEDRSGVPLAPSVGAGSAVAGPGAFYSPSEGASASAPVGGWAGAWVIENEIAIFWDPGSVTGEVVADFLSNEARSVIWPKLTALFGSPPAGRRIEILVSENPEEMSHATSHICTTNPEVVIAPEHHGLNYVLAHELTHALLYYRFPAMNGCNQSSEYRWMHEATAKWAEHFVYPTSMGNREHESAPHFLNEPTTELESFGDDHQYGAYLWFLYISKGKTSPTDPDVRQVPATWQWTSINNSLGAIDAGLENADLEEKWHEFALFNWNRIPHVNKPYRKYYEWDRLRHRARESTSAVSPGGFQAPKEMRLDGRIYSGYPMAHRINHLGAKYWHFDFTQDEKIRRIRIRHPYADGSEPKAKVQVIIKARGEDWRPAADWTGFSRKTLCRDKTGQDGNPSEDIEELVVIISDSEHQNRSHVLEDTGAGRQFQTFLEMSALGCTNWVGTVDFSTEGTLNGIHFTETGSATNVRWEIDQDRFSSQTFKVTGGTVGWAHSASGTLEDGDSCTGNSQGGYALDPNTGQRAFEFSAVYNSNPPLVPKYNAYGFEFGAIGPDDYECIDSVPPYDSYFNSPVYGAHDIWLDFGDRFVNANSPGLYDYQGPGGGLLGFASVQDEFFDYKSSVYIWAINRDPDPATRFTGFDVEPQD